MISNRIVNQTREIALTKRRMQSVSSMAPFERWNAVQSMRQIAPYMAISFGSPILAAHFSYTQCSR